MGCGVHMQLCGPEGPAACNGFTALILAGFNGRTATAQALLAAGAHIEAKDNSGDTALHCAGLYGHTATARALLAAGAQTEAKNNYGSTALDLASGETRKLLEEAAKVRDLVSRAERGRLTPADKSNLDSMAEAFPWTALQYASLHGLQTAAKNILDSKASVDKPNKDGFTALILAGFNGHTATAQALLAAGAHIEAKNNSGWTALHLAGLNGHTATAQALLAAGAHIEAKDNYGSTALDLARFIYKPETIKLLEEAAKMTPQQRKDKWVKFLTEVST
eukprot:g28445.t1